MSTSGKNVVLWLAFLALLLLPGVSRAANQYCATRYMPGQQVECFKTLAQAESYIRAEPSPAIGNSMLVRKSESFSGADRILIVYGVNDTAPTYIGDYYSSHVPTGKHRGCWGITGPGPSTRGCDNEELLQQDILGGYPYAGDTWSGSFSGGYVLSDPSGWGSWDAQGPYVIVGRNPTRPGMRTFRATLAPSGAYEDMTVDRNDWFECPPLFLSKTSLASPVPVWPNVCYNGARAEILIYQPSQSSDCPKDGNPLVAATGNKECNEFDFAWEGLSFGRSYSSGNDLSEMSALGAGWTHSLSEKLLVQGGSPIAWRRNDNYYEVLVDVDASNKASRTSNSTAVFREPDEVAATYARWRVTKGPGQVRWFDDAGRIKYKRNGDRLFSYEYCEAAFLGTGSCLSEGLLLKVRSPSGRALNFSYAMTATGSGSSSPRLIGITADGVAMAAYAYDTSGRLKYSSHGTPAAMDSREYLYAESSRICRDATGTVIVDCDPQYFANYLTGVLDEYGNRYATYTYDERGRTTISEHAGGTGRVSVVYQADGKSKVTLPEGTTKTYSYLSHNTGKAPSHATLEPTDGSIGHTTHANYTNDRLDWYINANGSRTTYQYTNWRETSRTEGLDFWGTQVSSTRKIQTDWNAPWAAPAETRTYNASNALVAKSTRTYNSRGQVLTSTTTDPATPTSTRTSTTTYCEAADVTAGTCPLLGLVISVNGPRTDVTDTTQLTYYASDEASCATTPATCAYRKGDLWKATNALGQVTETLRYDGAGRALSVKDPNGVITDMEYHPRGWMTAQKVRGPNSGSETDDAITRYEYTPTGLVNKITQPDGSYTTFGYDAAHRLTMVTDNAGNQIVYTLDNAGQRTKEDTKDSGGALLRTLSRVYNQLGQLKTGKDAYNHATGYVYDVGGNLDTVTDALGTVTDNSYDPLGRLVKTLQDTAGINAQTQFQYDALDRLTQVTDPKGLNTQYQYNGLGDLTQLTSPDTGVTSYSYDAAGNRTGQTDARAVTSGYQYDALNRLTGVTYPTASLNVAYTYDTAQTSCTTGETYTQGRLTRMSDASGQTDYCYDRFGNLVRKTIAFGIGTTLSTRYSYALGGALTGIVYPDGTAVDYQRDAQGRINEVGYTRSGGTRQRLVHNVQYAAFGPVTAWTYDNGRVLQRLHDQNYAPTRVADTSGSGLYVDFTQDSLGRISELRNRSNVLDARYRYDALSRLDQLQDGPSGTPIETYTYDATGNRTGKTTSAGSAAYAYPGTSHRLSSVGGVARTYSDNGNTTSMGGTALQLSYDDSNRLVQTQVNNAVVMNYAYNGRGEQVRRYLGGASKLSVYDEAGQWLGEYDGVTPLQQVIWLDNYPVGLLVGAGVTQKLHYIQPDHLGTPREVIDPQRNVSVWKSQLKGEAFGVSPPEQDPDLDGTSFVFDLRYPGQRYDEASGLNYNYFRDYEPTTGRYSQSDPLGLEGGVGSYVYVWSDPLSWTDPQGLAGVRGGGGGKGERGYTRSPGGSGNEFKHYRPHPSDPGKVVYTDPQTGKKVVKPKPPGYPGGQRGFVDPRLLGLCLRSSVVVAAIFTPANVGQCDDNDPCDCGNLSSECPRPPVFGQ